LKHSNDQYSCHLPSACEIAPAATSKPCEKRWQHFFFARNRKESVVLVLPLDAVKAEAGGTLQSRGLLSCVPQVTLSRCLFSLSNPPTALLFNNPQWKAQHTGSHLGARPKIGNPLDRKRKKKSNTP
ncbi:unnamed protein product, partial [Ectocarpus sp. 13 AM-2016]